MSNESIRQALGDDIMADYEVDRTVEQALHLAKGLCARIHETWGPQEGCAEFMTRPEVHSCPDVATKVVVFEEHNQETGIDYVTEQLCPEHANEAKSHPKDGTDWLIYIGDVEIVRT